MACKFYIDNKVLNEQEIKQYIGEKYINKEDIRLTTIEDLANILAYSNSKLILPGYEVEYTTPDNQKFKTYQEASNHISNLAKSVKDVDLDKVVLDTNKGQKKLITKSSEIPVDEFLHFEGFKVVKKDTNWYYSFNLNKPLTEEDIVNYWNTKDETYSINDDGSDIDTTPIQNIKNFIEKNKEYEQAKEIIEEWKRINNIRYNPEEVYSRGQEFVSVVGAYSDFDVNLMMQNLLQHIEDNERAGGKFAISAFTKPIDKTIGHLEGSGGKIKFKIYPQSQDILWASNIDVYSGSVWDASEKINKDKKSELLGVSYTKYPALRYVNTVQSNLASIIEDLSHHHNELGIALTGNNFRLEYDEDIPYQTKKIIDGINSILDQKFGKLVKPGLNIPRKTKIAWYVIDEYGDEMLDEGILYTFYNEIEAKEKAESLNLKGGYIDDGHGLRFFVKKGLEKQIGIQPTQTKDNLKESIENIKYKILSGKNITPITKEMYDSILSEEYNHNEDYMKGVEEGEYWRMSNDTYFYESYRKEKDYTEQALINTKIATLKEVSKKYPRILIRSEVIKIKNNVFEKEIYSVFQKVENILKDSNKALKEKLNLTDEDINSLTIEELNKLKNCYL